MRSWSVQKRVDAGAVNASHRAMYPPPWPVTDWGQRRPYYASVTKRGESGDNSGDEPIPVFTFVIGPALCH
uniref:Uncharacterized protein n=1 Tax=Angiostrongylus cantonensis TaxID=6313 RepID=A0A0K0CVZ6_ANGCA